MGEFNTPTRNIAEVDGREGERKEKREKGVEEGEEEEEKEVVEEVEVEGGRKRRGRMDMNY